MTLLNAGAPSEASRSCNRTPLLPPSPQPSSHTSDPPHHHHHHLSVSLFFRSVAHGAEKIVFITCQRLAALSYATQDSIKLSYTGMKLQNRPGTPQQNYLIPPPPPPKNTKKGVCLGVFCFDRQGDVGFDLVEE